MWFEMIKIAERGTLSKIDVYINEAVSEEYAQVTHAALTLASLTYAGCATLIVC